MTLTLKLIGNLNHVILRHLFICLFVYLFIYLLTMGGLDAIRHSLVANPGLGDKLCNS